MLSVGDEEWEALTAELARHLVRMAVGDYVVLRAGPHFVQFRQRPTVVHAEAISNEYLAADRRLSDDDEQRLALMGWSPPSAATAFNWWADRAWPLRSSAARELAEFLVRTLRDVFGVRAAGEVTWERVAG
ncbi:TY-Chap domain-containing protein [Actinoplanes rectilineatus]|uniref:TY-Chap domain-containing protein n=1 Tax=Actinoplanes rectilineatus TaxID=113571 RepID=UPI0005F2E400|nr:hypothetical protein [Actinoplanes rectilineatus]